MTHEENLKQFTETPAYQKALKASVKAAEESKVFFAWWHSASVEEKIDWLLADMAPCRRNNCSKCKSVIGMIRNLTAYGEISDPPCSYKEGD